MLVDDRFDMPLIARLRPAALVVAAGRLVELVDQLLEPAGAQDVDGSPLTADDRDQRSVAAADERDERREVELPADGDLVGHRIASGSVRHALSSPAQKTATPREPSRSKSRRKNSRIRARSRRSASRCSCVSSWAASARTSPSCIK